MAAVVPLSVVVCLGVAAPAGAADFPDLPMRIIVANNTTAPDAEVTLVTAGTEECWNNGDLVAAGDKAAYRWVAPGQRSGFLSSRSYDLFRGCAPGLFGSRDDGLRQLQMVVRDTSQSESYLPQGDGLLTLRAGPFNSGQGGVKVAGGVSTWMPRRDGYGLICFRISPHTIGSGFSTSGVVEIRVYNDDRCNASTDTTPRPFSPLDASTRPRPDVAATTATHTDGPTPEATPEDAGTGNPGAIPDLLSTAGVVCPWWTYPGNAGGACDRINPGDRAKWSIANLKPQIRDFRITGSVGAADSYVSVGAFHTDVAANAAPGTVTVSRQTSLGSATTHQTQVGGRVAVGVGFEQSGKFSLLGLAEGALKFTQSLNLETNFSTNKTVNDNKQESRTATVSAQAKPGYRTWLDVFKTSRDANFEYAGDLDFGQSGARGPVATPANQALGQSPAERQPCLGYVVGNAAVYGSLQQIGNALLAAGFSPTEPTLSPARRAFLQSLSGFRTLPGTCPGFPNGFAAGAGFTGKGVGTYRSLGHDAAGNEADQFTACIYVEPLNNLTPVPGAGPPDAPNAPPTDSAPCQRVKNGGEVALGEDRRLMRSSSSGAGSDEPAALARPDHAGALLDFRHDQHADKTIVAPAGSDEIFAPKAGGTVYTNNGALDIVHVGRGPTKVIGGSGDNLIYGGSGAPELLQGGQDGTNYLIAKGARTTLRERNGTALMRGGWGADTFQGNNMDGVMFGGFGDDTMIARGDTSRVGMTGGSGANTYEVLGRGTPEIIQLPRNRKRSKLITTHSMRVPLYVARAVATGRQSLTLTGNTGTTSLKANNAGDVLKAGPGPEMLRGGRGRDTFVLTDENDDRAIGGRGANRYRFTGHPVTGRRPASMRHIRRAASTIVDFYPGKGDRLVLSARVFGANVLRLRHGFRIAVGRNPRPRTRRATLLFNPRTRVLRFDRDGIGPIPDQVIVRLRGSHRIPRRGWFRFVAR